MAEILQQLESHNRPIADETKQKIHEIISQNKDPWLVNGLYDYYLSTYSVRALEILINVREPHHIHLFDKLLESIRCSKTETKIQALTLLGYMVDKQPTWLYKITQHALFKEVLKLLKQECEIVPLLSALLALVVLLPCIPASMKPFLQEVFEIFSRLAAWNCNTPQKLLEDQMVHMQVSLFALFHRLYGMYPCNFLTYLRDHYRHKDRIPIFNHTIKPMLQRVQMHPLLVTTTKDSETTTERWMKHTPNDVVMECERFSVDTKDRSLQETCLMTTNVNFRSRSGTANSSIIETSQQFLKSTSLNTNISDTNFFSPSQILSCQTPPVTETTTGFMLSHIQGTGQSIIQSQEGTSPPEAAIEATPETTPIKVGEDYNNKPRPHALAPTSPLRIIPPGNSSNENSVPNSPLPIQRIDSPVSQEDEEVLAIVSQSELRHPGLRQCDSVIQDSDRAAEEDIAEEHGSPCTSGGLHQPNIKQMNNFRQNMNRLRHHSQCGSDGEPFDLQMSGSSSTDSNFSTITVRRANSCPEMKKGLVSYNKEFLNEKTMLEECDDDEDQEQERFNGSEYVRKELSCAETQTENFWPMPYEHLFLSVFPNHDNTEPKVTPAQSPAPNTVFNPSTIYDIIEKYTEVGVQINEKDPIKSLKDQVQLLSQQLLFERHRRETHAIKNRTLFTEVTVNRVSDEKISALSDQVKMQGEYIETLRNDLNICKKEKIAIEKEAKDDIRRMEENYKDLQNNFETFKDKNHYLQLELEAEKNKLSDKDKKWQIAMSEIFDAHAEVAVAKEQVIKLDKCRFELEKVNKELLLAGELILKYEERLGELDVLRRCEEEQIHLTETYNHEIAALQQQLESKNLIIEAHRSRISELEQAMCHHGEAEAMYKKTFNDLREEFHEKIKSVESKYRSQLSVNQALEEKIFDLYQQVESTCRRGVHSPDTSSCHEVNATMTDRTGTAPGLSPHSSPLSASLTSSEGSMAFVHSEMKNLQVIMDQRDTVTIVRSSTIESDISQEAHSSTTTSPSIVTSNKND
ncbi:PREDICTED: hamartin isoform X2 [Nicrophorus vespilloides]|uniref:Hamartin isoform X2 n=1 Tax=Nicrophorus vespilloides TaxID=110193 RepID=A0ABM1MKP0_NICVS|nr:PREDICTED: hamartin isoform X2 [Nicrophorus vespilloides]